MSDLPEKAQGIVGRVDRSARRMTIMIRDILDFARGRLGGGIPLNRQPMDLAIACAPRSASAPGGRRNQRQWSVQRRPNSAPFASPGRATDVIGLTAASAER
jgi:signal transduction histidine kinase